METTVPTIRKPTLTYRWTIDKFSECLMKKCLTENISIPESCAKQFRLVLYPRIHLDTVHLTYVYAFFSASDVANDEALICILILDSVGNKCLTTEGLSRTSNPGGDYYPQLTIKHNYLFNLVNDLLLKFEFEDRLTVYYEIFYGESKLQIINMLNYYSSYDYSHQTKPTKPYHDYLSIIAPYDFEEPKVEKSCFLCEIQDNLENDETLMINFELGDKDFCVHKHILAAQSNYFADLFSKDLQLRRIKITDVELEVFQEVLRYIYNGTVTEVDRLVWKLLDAAKKYQISGLEQLCQQLVSSTLTIGSVGRTLVLADMHNATQTKTKCIEYINRHSSEVMKTEGWREVLDTNRMDLMVELYEELVKLKVKD